VIEMESGIVPSQARLDVGVSGLSHRLLVLKKSVQW
jgi:hypothetical protein